MLTSLDTLLWLAALISLAAIVLELMLLRSFQASRRSNGVSLASCAPISVLKPLCGLDDDLEANLKSFVEQDHPDFELLLGVRSEDDAAWPLARDLERKHPERVRVVVQRGAPGLNPKVNQLITLANEARHELLLISDSNVRVRPSALRSVAEAFADPQVGLVTQPAVGIGGEQLGARLDNLHLTCSATLGAISGKQLLDLDFVIGKSMALRRRDVWGLCGFESVKDVLAEDYVLGRRVNEELGKRVALIHEPVFNVNRQGGVRTYLARYARWSVMQRQTVGLGQYTAQMMLNPTALSGLAFCIRPTEAAVFALCAIWLVRSLLEVRAYAELAGERFGLRLVPLVPLKDLLWSLAWIHGLLSDRIKWRGNALRVLPGSKLVPIAPESEPAWKTT
jgi:ceramide glucosyltransferase